MRKIKNYLRKLSEKFLDKFFYNYMVKIIEDEFEILVFLKEIGSEPLPEIRIKHLPSAGTIIILLDGRRFKIDSIELTHVGSVAYFYGKIIK